MPNIEPFELYSNEHDKWCVKNADKYELELAVIHDLIHSSYKKSMEVGADSGKFAVHLNIKIGVEPSHKMASRAKNQGIKIIMGVVENLPFSNASFDCVLMVKVICFLDNVMDSFKESRRMLKPGGTIIIGFVDRENKIGRSYMANQERSIFYKNAKLYSAEKVLELLKEAGFRVKKTRQDLIPGDLQETILDGFGKGAFVAIKGTK